MDLPVGTIATEYVATGTTTWSDWPLAMLENSTFPFTVMSAGGTAAVCATVSEALPFGTQDRSSLYVVITGLPFGFVGRWTTTSAVQCGPTVTIWSTTVDRRR